MHDQSTGGQDGRHDVSYDNQASSQFEDSLFALGLIGGKLLECIEVFVVLRDWVLAGNERRKGSIGEIIERCEVAGYVL